jgi:16S rRNA processing protein RimM
VRLSNIADRRAAQEAAGRELFALTSELPEALLSRLAENPDEGGAATDDAVGLRVVSTTHGVLGEVVEVLETGANQVWVVRGTDWGEVLLPVIDDVVLQINQEKRLAQVAVLPGLIEDSDGSGDA